MANPTLTAVIALLCVATWARPCSAADAVILRDGTRIEGEVRTKGDTFEIVTTGKKTVVVRHAEVQRIERGAAAQPQDFEVSDRLRQRVNRHRRLKALGAALRRGGTGVGRATKELVDAGPDALPVLGAALADDQDAVADAAVRALGTVGGRAAADHIAEHLPDLKPDLQLVALDQLIRMGAVHTVPAIDALIRSRKTPLNVKKASVVALGRLGGPHALPGLMTALTTPGTISVASQALIALDSPAALPYLDRILLVENTSSRAAARVIAKVAGPEHIKLLLRLQRSRDDDVSRVAGAALERLKASTAARTATYMALLDSGNKALAADAAVQLRRVTKHEEDTPAAWKAWWLKQNRARARIAVVPVGTVDASLTRIVRRTVEKATGVRAVVVAAVAPSRWARIPGSRRYRADALLDAVERRLARRSQVIAAVAVTPARIEMPGQGPTIGAFRTGSCGLISLPGLEAGKNATLLRARLARHALHVLARSLRIRSAEAADCPAGVLYEAAELDRFKDRFSEATAGRIETSVQTSVALLACDLDGAIGGLNILQNVAEPAGWAVEIAVLAERKLNLPLARRLWLNAAKACTSKGERTLIEERIKLIDAVLKIKRRR